MLYYYREKNSYREKNIIVKKIVTQIIVKMSKSVIICCLSLK